MTDLNKFLKAQSNDYEIAFKEIKSGKKISHWMWYIFPQFKNLGYSEISKYYAINSLNEATEYLNHPILGTRLREITAELLNLKETNATKIFGFPDDLKLKSSATLFSVADKTENNIFKKVIDKFFNGLFDDKTLNLIKEEK